MITLIWIYREEWNPNGVIVMVDWVSSTFTSFIQAILLFLYLLKNTTHVCNKQDFLVSSVASITPTLYAASHQSFSSRSPYGLIESIVQHLFKWQTAWCSFTTGNGVNINAITTKPVQNWKVGASGTHAVQDLREFSMFQYQIQYIWYMVNIVAYWILK